MLRRLNKAVRACRAMQGQRVFLGRKFCQGPNVNTRFDLEEISDEHSDWDDDMVIEMMLSGIRIEEKSLLPRGVETSCILGKKQEVSQKDSLAKKTQKKSKTKKKGDVVELLEFEKHKMKTVEIKKTKRKEKESVETLNEKKKSNAGRKKKEISNEEFPFPMPNIETPRPQISVRDIFDSEKNKTMNEFLFEAALSLCRDPKHFKNLLTGLGFYQKKWFELGMNDSTSFLGDLGVLYSTEARQLIEEQMELMQLSEEGRALLRYVDPLELNLENLDLKKLERGEWSREIPLFFDFWQIAKNGLAHEKELTKREGKRDPRESPMSMEPQTPPPSLNSLQANPALEIEKLERENYNLKREILDEKQDFIGSASKRDFEMIWSSFQQAKESLRMTVRREETAKMEKMYNDQELETLLGVEAHDVKKVRNFEIEKFEQRDMILESLRGKMNDFGGFQSKYIGTRSSFLRDYSKEFRESEQKVFEKFKMDNREDESFNESNKDEFWFSKLLEKKEDRLTISPNIKDRFLNKISMLDSNIKKQKLFKFGSYENSNLEPELPDESFQNRQSDLEMGLKNKSEIHDLENDRENSEFNPFSGMSAKFPIIGSRELETERIFEEKRLKELFKLSVETRQEDEESDSEIRTWNQQIKQSMHFDLFKVRELNDLQHGKSARRVNLEKNHTRPLELAANYSRVVEIYQQLENVQENDDTQLDLLSEFINDPSHSQKKIASAPKVSSFSLQEVVAKKFKQFTFRKSDYQEETDQYQMIEGWANGASKELRDLSVDFDIEKLKENTTEILESNPFRPTTLFPSLKSAHVRSLIDLKAPVSPNQTREMSKKLSESSLGHQKISRPKNYLDESELRSVLSNLGNNSMARKALESIEFQDEMDALDPDGFESKYGAQFDSRKEVIKTAHLTVDKVSPVESSWVYLFNLPFDFDRTALEGELSSILGRFGEVEKSLLFRYSDFYTHEMHMEMDVFLEKGGEKLFLYDYHNAREREKKKNQDVKSTPRGKQTQNPDSVEKPSKKESSKKANLSFYDNLFKFSIKSNNIFGGTENSMPDSKAIKSTSEKGQQYSMDKFEERLKNMMDNSTIQAEPVKDGGKLVKELEERETLHSLRSLKRSFGFLKFKTLQAKKKFLADPLRIFGMTPSPSMHFKMDDADYKTTLIVANLPKVFPLHQFMTFLNLHLKSHGLPSFETGTKVRNVVISSKKVYLTFENFEQAMRASLLFNQLEFSGRSLVTTFLEGSLRYIGGQCFEDLDFLTDDYRQMKLKQADSHVKERLALLPQSDFLKISERSALEKQIRLAQDDNVWWMKADDFKNPVFMSGNTFTVEKGDHYSKMVDFVTNLVDMQRSVTVSNREARGESEEEEHSGTEVKFAKSEMEMEKKDLKSENEQRQSVEKSAPVEEKSQEDQECDRHMDEERNVKLEIENPESTYDLFEQRKLINRADFDDIFVGVETKSRRF